MTVAETAEEDLAQDKVGASTPTRGDEAVGTPPPSSVAEEGDKVLTPPPSEEVRAPSPAPAGASTPEGSPSRGKDPMIPVTMAGGSAEGEVAQAASDDEVEEIQGRPHDGRNMFTCGASMPLGQPQGDRRDRGGGKARARC